MMVVTGILTNERIHRSTTEAKGQPDAGVMGRYQHILRHRLLMMGALALAILGSLLLDFTMGPSGLSLSSLWQTLLDPPRPMPARG